ncbi:MAG: hypothetical protein Q4G44_08845 [Alcaligenaceae bacterium]|nr:hypothetical protein [Alcaligenaceae bacterium]
MQQVNLQGLTYFLEKHEGPCLSLYQPTHRSHPENQQDPIRYKNLLRELEQSLAEKHSKAEIEAIMKPFHDLGDNREFWQQQTLDGLAILADQQKFQLFTLQRQPEEFAVVSDSFHLKPLLRISQTQDRFQVLCITRTDVQMYEGTRDGLDQVIFADDFPAHIDEATDVEADTAIPVTSYGLGPSNRQGQVMHYQGGRKEAVQTDKERFLGAVARALHNNISKDAKLPVVLVGLSENLGIFRKNNQNPYVLEQEINIDPSSLTVGQLLEKAWALVEPVAAKRVQEEIARFNQAHGTGLANGDLNRTLAAILDGRVETLLVDAEKRVAGKIDREERRIELLEDFSDPEAEDILDDLAEMVLRRGGEVKIIPSQYMPTDTGLASIYRF